MTRIKLTEESWDALEQLIAAKYNTMGRDFTTDDEQKLEQFIQQILENQNIVDEIIKVTTEKTPLLLGKDAGLNKILNAIVHHSTGKYIKELT